jgi:hypothetical protein
MPALGGLMKSPSGLTTKYSRSRHKVASLANSKNQLHPSILFKPHGHSCTFAQHTKQTTPEFRYIQGVVHEHGNTGWSIDRPQSHFMHRATFAARLR